MNETQISRALDKAFSNEKLNPITLARKTSRLFTDSMNDKLHRWFTIHWHLSYPDPHVPDNDVFDD